MKDQNLSNDSVTLFVCGDILNNEREDGLICSDELAHIIGATDYAICNFEAPIEGFGTPAAKQGIYHTQKEATIKGLRDQGFGLLLLANNHILDYGEEALVATLKKAEENQLDTIGAGIDAKTAFSPLVKIIKGVKIGIINAGEDQHGAITSQVDAPIAGYAWINDPVIEKNIIGLKSDCDFVIVFSHAGLEHYPIPQKEWRIKYRHFCDLGADLVIGSHPHYPQGIELYQESLIFYSLGNFYFATKKNRTREDTSFSLRLELNKGGEINYKIIYHNKKDGLVHLSMPENRINVEWLNRLLDTEYEVEHQRMTLEVFNDIKKRLSKSAFYFIALDGRFKSLFRYINLKIFRYLSAREDNINLLYLLKNESYFYVLRNGIELTINKGNERNN